MSYSLTERKRIRKSFAKRAIVQKVPFLIATQLESYTGFLQAHVAPESRRNEGLQAAFTSIFPIVSHSGNARLEFVSKAKAWAFKAKAKAKAKAFKAKAKAKAKAFKAKAAPSKAKAETLK